MKKIRIKVIAPYEGLKQLVLSVAPHYENFDVSVEVGNLSEAIAIAERAEKEGYDIILSRGGTAEIISSNTMVPIVNIGVSGYDILRAIRLSQNYLSKIAIVGYESVTRGCRAICELLQIDMDVYTLRTGDDIKEALERLKQKDVNVVIGDVITVETAKMIGINGMLITSGEESVHESFREVIQYFNHFRRCREYERLLEAVISSASHSIFVFNSDKELLFYDFPMKEDFDHMKEKLSACVDSVMENKVYSAVIPGRSGTAYEVSGNKMPNENQFHAKFTLKKIDTSDFDESATGFKICNPENLEKMSFNMVTNENEYLKEVLEKARVLSKTDLPVLLEGERGTGKDMLAGLIFKGNEKARYPLIIIDCLKITADAFHDLLFKNVPQTSKHWKSGLFFKNIDRLSEDGQTKMLNILPELQKFRILASSEHDLQARVESGEFSKELLNYLCFTIIRLPPLRQRMEDLEGLSGIIIGRANERLGKQVVGIEKQARPLMLEYNWNGNIDQLKHVLFEAVKVTNGSYITKKTLEALLSSHAQTRDVYDIASKKTLDVIEKEIIFEVLKQENMNQACAAKRLGISRSTLWRKLK